MKNKEELLREVLGEYYDSYIKKNDPLSFIEMERLGLFDKVEEIETNNGWIKIESEADLPKKSGLCYILDEGGDVVHSEFDVDFGQFFTTDFAYDHYEVTHYQPISKPKPPLY